MEKQLDISIYIGSRFDVEQAEEIVADMIKLYYLDGISTNPALICSSIFLR